MAIKIDIISPPNVTASEEAGSSIVVDVIKSTQGPITTDSSHAIIDIVGRSVVGNVVVSETEPADPYNGMLWFSW